MTKKDKVTIGIKCCLYRECKGCPYDEVGPNCNDVLESDFDKLLVQSNYQYPITIQASLEALKDNGWTECTYNGEVFAMIKQSVEHKPCLPQVGLW